MVDELSLLCSYAERRSARDGDEWSHYTVVASLMDAVLLVRARLCLTLRRDSDV